MRASGRPTAELFEAAPLVGQVDRPVGEEHRRVEPHAEHRVHDRAGPRGREGACRVERPQRGVRAVDADDDDAGILGGEESSGHVSLATAPSKGRT